MNHTLNPLETSDHILSVQNPTASHSVTPFSLKDAPALIERLLPVQKLSAEAYKEQGGTGKTLTALGSYWKGRKPLILNKACVLGCLLPATEDLKVDLEVFEMFMGMDVEALHKRLNEKNSKESRFIFGQHVLSAILLRIVSGLRKPVDLKNAAMTSIGMYGRESTHILVRTPGLFLTWSNNLVSCVSAIGHE